MNLWGIIKGLLVQDETDRSKEFAIEVDPAATTGTRTTLKSAQTTNREITLPDNDSELVDLDSVQTLENKTMDFSTGGNNSITADAVDIIYDNTTSGLTAVDTQAAIDEVEGRVDTVETGLADHLADAIDAHDASAISNVPAGTIVSDNVQDAIDELDTNVVSVAQDLDDHLLNPTDAHDASAVSYDNTTSGLTATEVQSAIDEVENRLDTAESNITTNTSDIATNTSDISTNATNISNHISNPIGAHAASAISVVPTGNLAADDVQEALEELQTDIDGLSAGSGTMVNLGTGAGVYKEKVLDEFRLRSIKAGANITVTENADEVLIEGAASGANDTLSNLASPTDINQDLTFDNSLNRSILIEPETVSGIGKNLTIQAGNAFGTTVSGGNLILREGISTGNVASLGVRLYLNNSDTVGSTPNTQSERFRFIGTQNPSFKMFGLDGSNFEIFYFTNNYDLRSNNYNAASQTAGVSLHTGTNIGTGGTGDISVGSGASFNTGFSGSVGLGSGQSTSGGGSGSAFLGSGNSTLQSGDINIISGNSSSSNSGDIFLTTGTAINNPSRGAVNVNAQQLYLNQTPLVENTSTFASYGVVNTVALPVGGFGIIIMQTTTAITIHGIEAGFQGQHLYIYNENNNNMTFANQSGTEPTVTNRIITCTGANFTSTGTSMHHLIYLSGRWVLQSSQV